ncbi:hypothetical protein [Sutcliffiella rhizosphaerae]|uniref:Uncharacterized protein n=1 Tax=Sutcliffiella rhizosphaerae TaxID=2880967 RepID=A0ABN8AKR1_9BACI|nr:hypothetical protein [Sutcliffiella rhizosphaerae]CAG9623738.1 hypothetical protein BACCIP111883_04570 [Sutcliffiella rhizosphaerae]
MSLFLLLGLLGMILFLWFKRPILDKQAENNKLVDKLSKATWFQSFWFAGLFLFCMNGVLFFLAGLGLFILGYFTIPFVHLLVMVLAVCVSIYLWISVNKAWQGTKSNRLKMSIIGSSFYLILTFIFAYLYITLEPTYPGEDIFMAAIGLFFAIIVTLTASITCFIITGFGKKKVANS